MAQQQPNKDALVRYEPMWWSVAFLVVDVVVHVREGESGSGPVVAEC